MPAKPLTPEQIEDAKRLRIAFAAWQAERQARNLPHTQADAAKILGFGQSALSQYLRGVIPLNTRVTGMFAALLGCKFEEISPTLGERIAVITRAIERNAQGKSGPAARPEAAEEFVEPNFSTERAPQYGTYPLITWAHAAIWPQIGDWLHDEEEDIWLPSAVEASKGSFYLKIAGESMSDPTDPRSFYFGNLILVDPQLEPTDRSFVVVKPEDATEAILRQMIVEGGARYLKTLNPAWPNRIVSMSDDVLVVGTVKSKVVIY